MPSPWTTFHCPRECLAGDVSTLPHGTGKRQQFPVARSSRAWRTQWGQDDPSVASSGSCLHSRCHSSNRSGTAKKRDVDVLVNGIIAFPLPQANSLIICPFLYSSTAVASRSLLPHLLWHRLHHCCMSLKARKDRCKGITAGSWKRPMKGRGSLASWTRVNISFQK